MIGIIILNYNTWDDVKECLDSIKKTTKSDYKIYLVDNGSTQECREHLFEITKERDDVTLILNDINGGFSYGNNIGIKKAAEDGCDYLLISNPDVVYYENTIDDMKQVLISDSRIGVVGPSTPSLDQPESQLLRKVYTPKVYFYSKKPYIYLSKINKNLRTEFPYPSPDSECPFLFKGMVRGCCFMISTKLFMEMGLFDDNQFLYSEEWIIAKKLSDLSLYCAFDFKVKALHKEATSTKKVGTGFQSFHLYLSAFYYLKYHTDAKKSYLRRVKNQNIWNFWLKSIFHKSYRKLYKSFVKAQKELYKGEKKTIRYNEVV